MKTVDILTQKYLGKLYAYGIFVLFYRPQVLHSKLLLVDNHTFSIGSANMDRRSFDLNYENNILIYDSELTGLLQSRQQEYIDASAPVLEEDVRSWSWQRRLMNNGFAIVSPLL